MLGLFKSHTSYHTSLPLGECKTVLRSPSETPESPPPLAFKPVVGILIQDESVKLWSQRHANGTVTVFEGRICNSPTGGTEIIGDLRASHYSRVLACLMLLGILAIGGGLTAFFLYAALFGRWTKGGEFRFLLPLIPAAFTVGMVFFHRYIAKIDPSPIDGFLETTLHARKAPSVGVT